MGKKDDLEIEESCGCVFADVAACMADGCVPIQIDDLRWLINSIDDWFPDQPGGKERYERVKKLLADAEKAKD